MEGMWGIFYNSVCCVEGVRKIPDTGGHTRGAGEPVVVCAKHSDRQYFTGVKNLSQLSGHERWLWDCYYPPDSLMIAEIKLLLTSLAFSFARHTFRGMGDRIYSIGMGFLTFINILSWPAVANCYQIRVTRQ